MANRALPFAVLLIACGPATRGIGEGESESGTETLASSESESESGDGDGDGDGEPGDGDGDGEGEPGDGDGEPGDGDGDGSPLDELLTIAHMQVKGTHNSYHVEPLIPFDASHEYSHPPLDVQLEDFGVRAFELDLHRNGSELQVYHILVIDDVSTCDTLVECLTAIKSWSDQHLEHVPITVWFEIKDSTGGMPIDDLLLVDQTILDVFPPSRVLTPDFVRGGHATLREAIETDGWPTLAQTRGKILFAILNGDHPSVAAYTYGHTSLLGRMMFVGVDDFTSPYAALSKINDPASGEIAQAHAAGVLTASNTCGAGQDEEDCFAELAAGMMTGTHNLMDDFLAPGESMTYFLDLPDGSPVRCNEATAPPECTAAALEQLP